MDKKYIKYLKLAKPDDFEYSSDVSTSKKLTAFIKQCERLVRSSDEYRNYIAFLRENVDMDRCAFLENVSNATNKRVKIEIHHEPFTLYDIVSVIISNMMSNNVPLNDMMVADETMRLHYENKVGLIPLSKTIHQVIHSPNPKIMIPINMCFGSFKDFVGEYEIPDHILDKLEAKITASKALSQDSFTALHKCFEYIETDNTDGLSKLELEDTIREIQQYNNRASEIEAKYASGYY